MRLKLIKGTHLTAREKQVLAYAIKHKAPSAHSTRINADHVMHVGEGIYSATLWHWDTDMWGRRIKRNQSVTVQVI